MKPCLHPLSLKCENSTMEKCIFESSLKNTETQQGGLHGEASIGSTGTAMVSDDHYSETKWAENGVPLSSFYSWQRKMRSALLQQESVQFEELSPSSPKTAAVPPTQITLHIRDVTVELPADLPSDQISEIIRGIRNAG